MLHLGLVVLPQQLDVGVMVHPLWPIGERLHHVSASAQMLPDLLRPSESPVPLVLALALVAKVIAMPAQKILPRPVQLRHPPAAPGSWADEPGALSPEVTGRPLQRHRFFDGLPLGTLSATVAVGEDYLVPGDEATYGACLPIAPRPRGAKACAWL